MTLLQSILATVAELKPKSGFGVSSIFVTEKIIVLENPSRESGAYADGLALDRELRQRFPDSITTDIYGPDIDGTCLSITYA